MEIVTKILRNAEMYSRLGALNCQKVLYADVFAELSAMRVLAKNPYNSLTRTISVARTLILYLFYWKEVGY